MQTKLFLLLQTEQYDPALALIESDADPSRLAYECTYSLYRLQKETEAKDLLEDVKKSKGEDDRGILHLEAQLVSETRLELPPSTHVRRRIIVKEHIGKHLSYIINFWTQQSLYVAYSMVPTMDLTLHCSELGRALGYPHESTSRAETP